MELGLNNKKVLITGGSKGIGLACARAFMAEGARVAIVSRSQANLDAAKKELKDCYCIAADLIDAAAGRPWSSRWKRSSARSTCW